MIDYRENYTELLNSILLESKIKGYLLPAEVEEHQKRVGKYAFDIAHRLGKPVGFCWCCWFVGNLHDWVEDCSIVDKEHASRWLENEITEQRNCVGSIADREFNISRCLWKLTRKKGEEYSDYMNNLLVISRNSVKEDEIAFIVKQADYKDHFAQVETLTPKLLKKYAPFVHYFL